MSMTEIIGRTSAGTRPSRQDVMKSLAEHRCRLLGMTTSDFDLALADLSAGVGFIGGKVVWNLNPKNPPFHYSSLLKQTAAFAMGWADSLKVKGETAYASILKERAHQMQLYRDGEILFDCSSPDVDPKRKHRALVEELGEVAEAVDMVDDQDITMRRRHLYKELIQVAAIAVAWLESLEVKP
jgi:hypothetical protein